MILRACTKSCETSQGVVRLQESVHGVVVRHPDCGEGHLLVDTLATEALEQGGAILSWRVLQRGLGGSFALPIPREKDLCITLTFLHLLQALPLAISCCHMLVVSSYRVLILFH